MSDDSDDGDNVDIVQDTDDPRYQEDQQLLQGPGVAGGAQWSGTAYSATSSTKTSQRTYTDSDGTQITEVLKPLSWLVLSSRLCVR